MDAIITKFYTYLLTEKRVSANTLSSYKHDIVQFVNFLRKRQIDDWKLVTIRDLKDFLHHLKLLGLSARSMSRKISSLKLLFSYLQQNYDIHNYALELSFPKIDKKLPNYLSEEDVEQLLQSALQDKSDIGERNKVMLYLLYVSGMRISELINLKLSNIHFDTGFVAVQGKGGKGRMVPIPHPVLELLQAYIKSIHASFKRCGRETEYLFPIYYAKKIKPISRQSFWIILKQLCKKAGINRSISPHTLRHSLATHMLKKGADLRSLQLLLGHETLATVHIYTHIETSYVRTVYDKKHPRS